MYTVITCDHNGVHSLHIEYGEISQPAESPDDWVTQDRVPARPGIDERAYLYGVNALSDWEVAECLKWHDMPIHGQSNNCGGLFQLRCRRKDLPPVPVVPKTRTVTLREYSDHDDRKYWTSLPGKFLGRQTGRTCVTEVPE